MPEIQVVNKVTEQDKRLFRDVNKVHLADLIKGHSFPTGVEYAIVDDAKHVLNFCTEDYSLVPNKKLFLPVEQKLKQAGIDYERQVKTSTESVFYVSYLLKQKKAKQMGDLYPKLTIVNSYDSSVKFRYEFGWFRLVCTNGLTRPHGTTEIQVKTHNAGLTEADLFFTIMEIMEHTEEFITHSKKDLDLYEHLNSKKIQKKLIADVVKQAGLTDKIATAAEARFALETGESKEEFTYVDFEGNIRAGEKADKSLFTLYNAINYAIYNSNPKEAQESKAQKDSKVLTLVEAMLN